MENENAYRNFDDLVFENRNKQYGAYTIRKSYNDNMNKAVMVAVLSCGLVITLSAFISEGETHKPTDTKPLDTIAISNPPDIIIEPQTRSLPSIRSVNNNVVPVVTPDQVEETPHDETQTINSDGDIPGEAVAFPSEGLVTEEPTIVKEPPPAIDTVNWASVMPRFVGGPQKMTEFIQKTFRYPAVARRTDMQGTVYVSFVVDTKGDVIKVKLEKGISKECDKEAKRIIETMPKWIAGKQGNVPVAVRQYLPIRFQLDPL